MDRNVRKVAGVLGTDDGADEPPPQEKLLKFFPAEALALYSGLEPLAKQLGEDEPNLLKGLLWGTLAITVLFCLLFLRQFWKIETETQLAISAGSLILYVAALGGPFETLGWYDPLMGVAAAIVASAFLIFVKAPAKPT